MDKNHKTPINIDIFGGAKTISSSFYGFVILRGLVTLNISSTATYKVKAKKCKVSYIEPYL